MVISGNPAGMSFATTRSCVDTHIAQALQYVGTLRSFSFPLAGVTPLRSNDAALTELFEFSNRRAVIVCPLVPPRAAQKLSFIPNWICREVVEVVLMTPAAAAGTPVFVRTIGEGIPQFAWFKILKTSARNCMFHLSDR